jgi:dTDP-4-dehydrorhamnose reductase
MILLLGKSGYVSKRFQDYFNYKNIEYRVVSLREKPEVVLTDLLKTIKPRFVINAMGYTGKPNVDACELQKRECLYVNVILAEIVADTCRKFNIPLGFVSSGCIYLEYEVEYWHKFSENSKPNFTFAEDNCSWYSGTKALGESLVKKSWDKTYIWRLRMPFNHIDGERNYLSKILSYNKIWSSPNSLSNLDEFVKLAHKSMVNEISYGIYNMINPLEMSARGIHEIAKKHYIGRKSYEYFENLEEFNKIIETPRSNCVLTCSKSRNEGIYFLDAPESVDRCFSKWNRPDNTIFW